MLTKFTPIFLVGLEQRVATTEIKRCAITDRRSDLSYIAKVHAHVCTFAGGKVKGKGSSTSTTPSKSEYVEVKTPYPLIQ